MKRALLFLFGIWCWQLAGGQVSKALLIGAKLYTSEAAAEAEGAYHLKSWPADGPGPALVTDVHALARSPFYDFPTVWDIRDSLAYAISSADGRSPGASRFSFFRVRLAEEAREIRRARDSLIFVEIAARYPDRSERKRMIDAHLEAQSRFRNRRSVFPLYYLFRWLSGRQGEAFFQPIPEGAASFDMLSQSDSIFWFYICDERQFTVWRYRYPAPDAPDSPDDWIELATYSLDTVGGYRPPETSLWYHTPKLEYHPSGKDHRYQSIPDSAFFQGHFKAIRQGGETFIFNTTTGYLYHLGPEDIARVGQVNLQNYPRWLFGKPLFIEDRDAGELVFFAEAERA
jgi:hypothetical protein